MTSRDGFTWTPGTSGSQGLPSISVINPPQKGASSSNEVFDAIVIGSGYAGLVAARDLVTQGTQAPKLLLTFHHTDLADSGHRTLLIEARDRIGGRTWHSTIDGFNYEMGGTWIHWEMPHIYREVSLYGLHDDWMFTETKGGALDFCTLTGNEGKSNLSHEDEVSRSISTPSHWLMEDDS